MLSPARRRALRVQFNCFQSLAMTNSGLCRNIRASLTSALLLLAASAACAQVNPVSWPPRDEGGLAANTTTMPADDAVLDIAPREVSLVFPNDVRLVKLTLRDETRAWVEINFRYNPRPRRNFVWELPELSPAVYYTADWAILSAREQLIRGSFSFAFGAGAQPPSLIREAEELFLQQRAGTDPDTRYVAPPPTRIIINRDPPRFDPPFTIDLDTEEPC
ncbi:MAG: copper resistance protein CopC [Gammaproteobacteria bacterium]|nr:copper resistance protein CopC [Gammaproteobacteria bacterium]